MKAEQPPRWPNYQGFEEIRLEQPWLQVAQDYEVHRYQITLKPGIDLQVGMQLSNLTEAEKIRAVAELKNLWNRALLTFHDSAFAYLRGLENATVFPKPPEDGKGK